MTILQHRQVQVACLRWDLHPGARETLSVWSAEERSSRERRRDELMLLALLLARAASGENGGVRRRVECLARALDAGSSIGAPPGPADRPSGRSVLASHVLAAGVPDLEVVVSRCDDDVGRAALALLRLEASCVSRRPALARLVATIAADPGVDVPGVVGEAVDAAGRPGQRRTGKMVRINQVAGRLAAYNRCLSADWIRKT